MTELIVALDEPAYDDAVRVADACIAHVKWFKVGYEAFFGYGDRLIAALHERDASIFLDLKLHDIPNSVAGAVRSLARYRPAMLTLHAAGGYDMMAAAARARDEVAVDGTPMRLLAVTVLTSLAGKDQLATGIDRDVHEVVAIRAELALRAHLDGVVCAVEEASIVRARCEDRLTIVCPGIRPYGAAAGDQRRTATPADAVLAGARYIVVGRPITQAPDPGAAAQALLAQLAAVKPLLDV